MTKAERDALVSDITYFDGLSNALRVGLFTAESARNLVALQQVTGEKLKALQAQLDSENKRIEKLIDLGGQDGSSTRSTAAR